MKFREDLGVVDQGTTNHFDFQLELAWIDVWEGHIAGLCPVQTHDIPSMGMLAAQAIANCKSRSVLGEEVYFATQAPYTRQVAEK